MVAVGGLSHHGVELPDRLGRADARPEPGGSRADDLAAKEYSPPRAIVTYEAPPRTGASSRPVAASRRYQCALCFHVRTWVS